MTISKLITDDDILHGRVTSPIVLQTGTVITPAARDRAHARGMTIVERGEPAPPTDAPVPAAPCASGGCACGRSGCSSCAPKVATSSSSPSLVDGLPDGTYLIAVRDGRAVSVLPSTGPGLMPRRI